MTHTPSKFVGLHAHSGFSTFDGLGYPDEHIDFAIENGMDAIALTDHGHMNGFAHGYLHVEKLNAKGANFKFIPGCEMYVIPDLELWAKDHEIQRSLKKSSEVEIQTLRQERRDLVTPIIALTDTGSEVGAQASADNVNDNQLTIENEEETKSSKFYDPVKRRHHLVVLPKTKVGIQRIFHLVSQGFQPFLTFPDQFIYRNISSHWFLIF